MDKDYQDVSIVNRNFQLMKIAIPRMSKLISIFFENDGIKIKYINTYGLWCCDTIPYEQLAIGFKIVID